MNRTALTRLAQLLRKPLPKGVNRFDMRMYYRNDECGTAACACGLAAMDPWFNKRGLNLTPNLAVFSLPRFDFELGDSAIGRFFDIPHKEIMYLFGPDSYKRGNRLDVARRIEGFVRKGGEL